MGNSDITLPQACDCCTCCGYSRAGHDGLSGKEGDQLCTYCRLIVNALSDERYMKRVTDYLVHYAVKLEV